MFLLLLKKEKKLTTQELKGILPLLHSQALLPLGNGSGGETLNGSYPSSQAKEMGELPS